MAIEKKKESQTVFKTLNAVNVTPFTEKFNNLSYLTWSKAIEVVLDLYPDMSYEIVFNEETNLPFFVSDEGIMCYTKVTIEGVTRMMWLPVMDHTNRAMKTTPYQYQIFDKWEKKFVTKTVEAATMFDINKTIMRCLTKNLAMFGLGLHIYMGEDLPTSVREEEEKKMLEAKKEAEKKAVEDMMKKAVADVKSAKNLEELRDIYKKYKNMNAHEDILKFIGNAGKEKQKEEKK